MHLSTVDRLVKKLGPVNSLIENLCERLLPNQVAHASGPCMEDWGCGVITGSSYATYYVDASGNLVFAHCGC